MRFMKYTGVVAALFLAGCATHMDKPYQKIHVSTPGVADAECVVSTPKNKYVLYTPDSVIVENSEDSLNIRCQKGNYYPAEVTAESRLGLKHQILNVWNGFVPGLAYDIASGSIYHYPKRIEVPMEQDPYAVLATTRVDSFPPPPPPLKGDRAEDTGFIDMAPVPVTPADDAFNTTLRK